MTGQIIIEDQTNYPIIKTLYSTLLAASKGTSNSVFLSTGWDIEYTTGTPVDWTQNVYFAFVADVTASDSISTVELTSYKLSN